MRKIILVCLLSLMAVCVYSADYELVFFKTRIKKYNNNTKSPNVSETLYNYALQSWFKYDEDYAYCFAIIKTDTNKILLQTLHGLKPLTKDDELTYTGMIVMAQDETDYMNGVKARPTIDYGGN